MRNIDNYLRVTEVLRPFSGIEHIDPEVLANANERGTAVHEACTALMNGLPIVLDNPCWEGYITSFQKWWNPEDKIIFPERWFCDRLMITGECDGIYVDYDQNVLFDLKTSPTESKTWKLQGSAYAYLARQNGIRIDRIEFIKLDKTGKKPKPYEYQEDFHKFECCLEVYRYFYRKKKAPTAGATPE